MTRRFFVWFILSLVFFLFSFHRSIVVTPLFTIDYISFDTTFYAQVFCIFTLNIEYSKLSIGRTHVWKFNLHSFRFADFLTFISICPCNKRSLLLLKSCYVLRDFKMFDTLVVKHSIGNSISFWSEWKERYRRRIAQFRDLSINKAEFSSIPLI